MATYRLCDKAPTFPASGKYFVADTAQLIGDVQIHESASVWFGAVLRADNDSIIVGEGSNVQDNCIAHADKGFPVLIGKNCTIGHGVILHGCVIGDESLIGMGAIVMNGVHIGKRCAVGAGALLTEGAIYPDNSLVIGQPARVVRKLNSGEVAKFSSAAARYLESSAVYNSNLHRLG